MEQKYGFRKMTVGELKDWLSGFKVVRTIEFVQHHHTYIPNYSHFKGKNHFELQKGMKINHVTDNGWEDIGQHFSIFPDGMILTGRNLESHPAGIKGNNARAVMIENVGNFDSGNDIMTEAQKQAIVELTAALCVKFNIPVTSDRIVYHHWYNLVSYERNNGTGHNKSCPGTNFFGGNKVEDCNKNFLPLVKAAIAGYPASSAPSVLKYVSVLADSLNVRQGPGSNNQKAAGQAPVTLGSVLRVYEEKNDWYRISDSRQLWVSGRLTHEVKKAKVTTDNLNVRTGPGGANEKCGNLMAGAEIFVESESDGWAKLDMKNRWVKKEFLAFV